MINVNMLATLMGKLTVKRGPLNVRFVYGLPQSSKQISRSDNRRVCIYGLLLETLSPGPVCIRSPVPLRVSGLEGLKAVQV